MHLEGLENGKCFLNGKDISCSTSWIHHNNIFFLFFVKYAAMLQAVHRHVCLNPNDIKALMLTTAKFHLEFIILLKSKDLIKYLLK